MKSECWQLHRVGATASLLTRTGLWIRPTDWQTDRCVTLQQKRDAKLRRIPLSHVRRHRRKQSVWIVGVSRLNISRMTGLTISQ